MCYPGHTTFQNDCAACHAQLEKAISESDARMEKAMLPSKLCVACGTLKPMCDYYRAGKYYQKRCKPCHNTMRNAYPHSNKYIPKKKGFNKLPLETRLKIVEELDTVPLETIWAKYKNGNFTYRTFKSWYDKGKIVIV